MKPQNISQNPTSIRGKKILSSKRCKPSSTRAVEIDDCISISDESENHIMTAEDAVEGRRDVVGNWGCFRLCSRRRRSCLIPDSDIGYESNVSRSSSIITPLTCEENSTLGSPTTFQNHLSKKKDYIDDLWSGNSSSSESGPTPLVKRANDNFTDLSSELVVAPLIEELGNNKFPGDHVEKVERRYSFGSFTPADDETALVEGQLDELSNQSSTMSFDTDDFLEDDNEQSAFTVQDQNYLDLAPINEESGEETEG